MNNEIIEFLKILKNNEEYKDISNYFTIDNKFYSLYKCQLYAYLRVSTGHQEFCRQIIELYKWLKEKNISISINNIYCDKFTGKTLTRKEYNKVRSLLNKNDYLIISEVSRLGRNWDETKEEWYKLRDENINKLIMDYDMLSDSLPFEKNIDMTLDRKFVQELIFNAILYVACKKIEEVSKSTKAGLITAKTKGKVLGHPRSKKANKENFIKTLEYMILNNKGQVKATLKTGFPKDTFTRDIKKCYEKYNTKDYNNIMNHVKKELIWPL